LQVTRRDCLSRMARGSGSLIGVSALHASTLSGARPCPAQQRQPLTRKGCTFGFSTYGMKSLPTEKAVQVVADVGFDAIEITVWPDWDAAPRRMSAERRKHVRQLLSDRGLELSALMEHLQPARELKQQQSNRDRLTRVAELGRQLSADEPGMIQTTLGGGKWEQNRALYRDRLGQWIEIGKDAQTVIAIKPHRGGGMSRPSEAVWLIEQLGKSPWLKIVYDYSHYAFRDLSVPQTVDVASPYLGHVAIKDAVQEGKRVVFQLPGSSQTFDYAQLLRLLYRGGYRGDICCEVSGMVWSQVGYDPLRAAADCYRAISPLFKAAGVPRR